MISLRRFHPAPIKLWTEIRTVKLDLHLPNQRAVEIIVERKEEDMKSYEEIVRAVVEGQVRSFIHDHPEVLDSGVQTWKTPRGKTQADQLKDSIAKRVLLDLTCADTKARIKASLEATTGGDA